LTSEIETLLFDIEDKDSEISTLTIEVEDLTSSLDDLQDKYDSLSSSKSCSEDFPEIEISYTSNTAIFNQLKSWIIEFEDADLDDSDWFPLYDDTDIAWHAFYFETIIYDFIVFFEDPGYGITNGVFFVNMQCWLDGPGS
jgi:hypothetical protein